MPGVARFLYISCDRCFNLSFLLRSVARRDALHDRDGVSHFGCIRFFDEVGFANSADGAYPIIGKVFKRCARFDTGIRITYCGIIDPVAHCASVFFHSYIVFGFYVFNNVCNMIVFHSPSAVRMRETI